MEIKYKFANGEESYVEVSEEIGAAILESRRKEENLNKKEYRHSAYSIDAIEYTGEDLVDKDTIESLLSNKEERDQVDGFLLTLTEVQRRRLEMRLDGMNMSEIARTEATTLRAIKKTFLQILEKYLKFFKK